jgi:hypothetical protein
LPARKKLKELGFLESELGCSFSFYDLDTDKNVLDYLTFLKISSTNNDFEQNRAHDVRHFFYPAVLLCCMVTTAFALVELPRTVAAIIYSMACMLLQILFARRPFSKAVRRYFGKEVVE